MRRLLKAMLTAALPVIGAGLVASAGSAGTPKPVSVSAPTPIAAYGERLVWSRRGGAGGFELVQRVGSGPVVRLPVPPRSVPFDVDLGPTSGGRVLAVYTRCRTEPTGGGIPEYHMGQGCFVYKLDVESGKETRYTAIHSGQTTESWPTYWKGRLGFARAYDKGNGSSAVYVKDVASSRRPERLPDRPPSCDNPKGCARPLQLELYGSRLAFVWRIPDEPGDAYELLVDTVGTGEQVILDRTSSGQTSLVAGWPAFEDGRVFWVRQCGGDPSGCTAQRVFLAQSSYTGKIVRRTTASPSWVIAHERAAGITWVLRDSPSRSACRDDPLTSVTDLCVLEPLRPSYAPRR